MSARSNIGVADVVLQEMTTKRTRRRSRSLDNLTSAFVTQPRSLHDSRHLSGSAPYQSLLVHSEEPEEPSTSIDEYEMPCRADEASGVSWEREANLEDGISALGSTAVCTRNYKTRSRFAENLPGNSNSRQWHGRAGSVIRGIFQHRTATLTGGTADADNMTLTEIGGRCNQQGGPAFRTRPPTPIAAPDRAYYELEPSIESQSQIKCERTTTAATRSIMGFTKTAMKKDTKKQGDSFDYDDA